MFKKFNLLPLSLLLLSTVTYSMESEKKAGRFTAENLGLKSTKSSTLEVVRKKREELTNQIEKDKESISNELNQAQDNYNEAMKEAGSQTMQTMEILAIQNKHKLELERIALEINQFKDLLQKQQSVILQLESEKEALTKELEEKKTQFEAGIGSREKLEKEIEAGNNRFSSLDSELNNLKKFSEDNNNVINDLTAKLNFSNKQMEELQEQLGVKKRKISKLKEEKTRLQSTIDNTMEKLGLKTGEITQTGMAKDQLEKGIEDLKAEIQNGKTLNEQNALKAQELTTITKILENTIESLSGEKQNLKKQLAEIIAKNEQEIAKLNDSIQENSNIMRNNAKAAQNDQQKLEELNAAYEEKKREAENLGQQLSQLQVQLEKEQEAKLIREQENIKNQNDIIETKRQLVEVLINEIPKIRKLTLENQQLKANLKNTQTLLLESEQNLQLVRDSFQQHLNDTGHFSQVVGSTIMAQKPVTSYGIQGFFSKICDISPSTYTTGKCSVGTQESSGQSVAPSQNFEGEKPNLGPSFNFDMPDFNDYSQNPSGF